MATLYSTKRVQDTTLDITLVVDFYLNKISSTCKASVAHAVSGKIDRLVKAKNILESRLKKLVRDQKGFFIRIKIGAEARRTKREILNINARLCEWLNTVYSYFVSK